MKRYSSLQTAAIVATLLAASLAGCGSQTAQDTSDGPSQMSDAQAGRRQGDAQLAVSAASSGAVDGTIDPNAFQVGIILDFDGLGPHGKSSAASVKQKTGTVPKVIDSYVRMKNDGTFETATANLLIDQAAQTGVPTVCLSVTSEVNGKLSTGQLSALTAAVGYGKSKKVAVQVRFGYEMNGYWSPSNSTNGVAGDPTNFKLQWAQVAPMVQAAGGAMFWSPNFPFSTASALARWQPAANTIDLVGIDYYPQASDRTLKGLRAALDTINGIAKQINKPLVFGETGVGNTGSSIIENADEAASKAAWLTILADQTVRRDYPLYQGFRWFDYQKFENNTYNNFSVSADAFAAKAYGAWYSSVFTGTSFTAGAANGINAATSPNTTNPNVTMNPNLTASAGATAGNNTSTFAAVSMDTLKPLAPARLQAIFPDIVAAATTYNLQPQLLVAIAMVESTGGSDPAAYTNNGGMFQFTDAGTWAAYGHGASRLDDKSEVEPAAHYMSDNLKASNNSLFDALRLYNGSIAAGGAPDYQARIKAFMMGQNFGE